MNNHADDNEPPRAHSARQKTTSVGGGKSHGRQRSASVASPTPAALAAVRSSSPSPRTPEVHASPVGVEVAGASSRVASRMLQGGRATHSSASRGGSNGRYADSDSDDSEQSGNDASSTRRNKGGASASSRVAWAKDASFDDDEVGASSETEDATTPRTSNRTRPRGGLRNSQASGSRPTSVTPPSSRQRSDDKTDLLRGIDDVE